MSIAEHISVGEVIRRLPVRQSLPGSGRRRRAVLVIPDRPRAIDRHIDYFGGRVGRPATAWSRATWGRNGIAVLSGPPGTAGRVLRARQE